MMQQTAIDFTAATVARDIGMAAAVGHADRVSAGWSEEAYAALCRYAAQAKQFTSYDFRSAVRGLIESPPTDKAYGAVFLKAARAGVIRRVGYAQHPERHCSPTPVWEFV
ncbi:MAG: hypothetical protein EG825_00310 [Rhodocyclaceae bacterium]|nr:hypothetical protein [Rhodocyclaceae bacterium]